MSHFECRLNQRFLAFIKVVQVVKIGGKGNLDKIQKNSSLFQDVFPNFNQYFWKL